MIRTTKCAATVVVLMSQLAGCGLIGDEASEKATEVIRNAVGDPKAAVWDVKVCRDNKTDQPLNAVGFVTGGSSGRVWLVEWGADGPRGDVDIEPEDASESNLGTYYRYLRRAKKGDASCRYVSEKASHQSNVKHHFMNGVSLEDAMALAELESPDYTDFTAHWD